jgi:hypothetical protein
MSKSDRRYVIIQRKEPKTMITHPTAIEPEKETPEQSKARRNAEYLAKLDRSFKQAREDKVVSMTFAEWEEWIKRA